MKFCPIQQYHYSALDVDWPADNIYVCDEKGIVYIVKVHWSDELNGTVVCEDVSVIYNGTQIPRAVKVSPDRG